MCWCLSVVELKNARWNIEIHWSWYRNSLPVMNWPESDVEHSQHLLPKLRISGAEPLLPICVVMAWAGSSLPLPWIPGRLAVGRYSWSLCSPYDVSGRVSVASCHVCRERDLAVEVRFDARLFFCGSRLAFESNCTAIATQSRLSWA